MRAATQTWLVWVVRACVRACERACVSDSSSPTPSPANEAGGAAASDWLSPAEGLEEEQLDVFLWSQVAQTYPCYLQDDLERKVQTGSNTCK